MGIVQSLWNHYLRDGFCRPILGQLGSSQATVELGAEELEALQPSARSARAGLFGVGTVAADHIGGAGGDARDQTFELGKFVTLITSVITILVPRGMAVVAEDQLRTNAADFS